jgi:hypothetical protein
MSDKHISKPVSSETYNNKQAKLISGSGLEDSASEAWPGPHKNTGPQLPKAELNFINNF